jgi:hypothetical protein
MPFLIAAGMLLLVGAVVLVCWSDIPLPEWMFPVRGRWLRYLLLGLAALFDLLVGALFAPEALVITMLVVILTFPFSLIACGAK